jgi:hypothetical protein
MYMKKEKPRAMSSQKVLMRTAVLAYPRTLSMMKMIIITLIVLVEVEST